MIGTWINVATILIGGLIGLVSGRHIPERMGQLTRWVIGLVTIVLGMKLAIETGDILALLLSLLVGGLLGTWMGIEGRIYRFGEWISRRGSAEATSLPQGFLTASVLFCVGPLALLGALRDGLYGDWHLLGLKSLMDGVSSMILAAGLGPGVLLSAGSVLVYQGGISLSARLLSYTFSIEGVADSPLLFELDAAGGVILIALGLKLLELKDLKAGNLLPALLFAPLFAYLFGLIGG